MSGFAKVLSAFAIAGALVGGNAFAQTSTDDKAKMDRAAKQKECKQQAKAKNLTGKEQNDFQRACMK